ncbi:reverse transcriptase domain-containing protein [Tanacetum coccineum]
MADHLRPMEEVLRIPILGIEDAIVVPAVLADQFELNPELLDFLILFPFSLKGVAETWLENESPNSITSWDDLVSKFLNRFFPHSKTRQIRKEITNFQQVFGETFTKTWERFKDLLRKCPHHGFSLLHQIDFFYNGLCQSDQDSLNTAAGGNLMTRNTQDSLTTIENKARVRTCRNTPQVLSSGGQMEEIFQERQSCVLPSNTDPRAELHVITSMDGLTLDGSFIPYSLVYQENEQEPETITKVVEISSSQSTPLVPPSETLPLSAPKPKEDPKPNPYSISMSASKRKNSSFRESYGTCQPFRYRIDIVDSLCDKLHIENNSYSGNPTLSPDPVIESLFPSLTPFEDIDLLLEETDAFLSLDDSIPPGIDNGIYDSEGDILFLEELLNDEILSDLRPKELKDDEPSTTKYLIEKPLEIDDEIYNSEGDILFLENL